MSDGVYRGTNYFVQAANSPKIMAEIVARIEATEPPEGVTVTLLEEI